MRFAAVRTLPAGTHSTSAQAAWRIGLQLKLALRLEHLDGFLLLVGKFVAALEDAIRYPLDRLY
jgi:hypothetical protein